MVWPSTWRNTTSPQWDREFSQCSNLVLHCSKFGPTFAARMRRFGRSVTNTTLCDHHRAVEQAAFDGLAVAEGAAASAPVPRPSEAVEPRPAGRRRSRRLHLGRA